MGNEIPDFFNNDIDIKKGFPLSPWTLFAFCINASKQMVSKFVIEGGIEVVTRNVIVM